MLQNNRKHRLGSGCKHLSVPPPGWLHADQTADGLEEVAALGNELASSPGDRQRTEYLRSPAMKVLIRCVSSSWNRQLIATRWIAQKDIL
jgi:hypothetical protein